MKKDFQKILLLGLMVFGAVVDAQIKEERLVLDKKRVPEVKKIEKKKTSVENIKNYPPEEKSSVPVQYDITNVPAVSDFKTSTIQGEDISPKFNSEIQKNYFRLGYGNYNQFLADGHISGVLENKLEVGADVHLNSHQGLKRDYPWASNQSTGNLGGYLTSYGEKGKLNLNAEYELNNYNYYGIYHYEIRPEANVDLKQKTNRISVNGHYDFYSNEYLNDLRMKTSFLSDRFGAKESQVSALLNLSKHSVALPIDEVSMNADLGLGFDFQNTRFDKLSRNVSDILNAEIAPKLTFKKGASYIMVGSAFDFFSSKYQQKYSTGLMNQKRVYWFPRAEVLLGLKEEFKFYAGVDGGLKINSYSSLLQENPFLISDLELKPTEAKYHIYFGLKGDFNENLKYDVKAGFAKVNNMAFYTAYSPLFYPVQMERAPYDYGNTFWVIYDDGTMSTINGNLQYYPLANLILDAELSVTNYRLKNLKAPLNKPEATATIGAKYLLLDKKLHLGFKGFFMSNRITNSYDIYHISGGFSSIEKENDKVKGYIDFNLSAEYKLHKNISIFALGNNLLNNKYELYKGYKVLGAQILGGLKLTF